LNAETIREFWRRRPFEPFAIVMSSGERHVVKHPELLMILPSKVVIGDSITDRLAILALIDITELRPLQPQASN
jgi:hypothetical protein